ncbi:MAG: hypothetical protein R2806_24860 [Saprospiraceae bacterium]
MRVFILSTGRCGSQTFIRACAHIENYTAGHESLSNRFGAERFDYPEDHIEADNRLSWHLGELQQLFGDTAFYIHLSRNRDQVARSFLSRFYQPGSMIDSFSEGIRMNRLDKMTRKERLAACYDYVDTIQANIEHFLSDKSRVMQIDLETIAEDFAQFWNEIGAKGDLKSAMRELKIKHNARPQRKLDLARRWTRILTVEWKNLRMTGTARQK